MKCIQCGSTETDIDHQLGHIVCIQCGSVLEQDSMVSEVQFIETKGQAILDGFVIKSGQGMFFILFSMLLVVCLERRIRSSKLLLYAIVSAHQLKGL
jgi:hypothetical protein